MNNTLTIVKLRLTLFTDKFTAMEFAVTQTLKTLLNYPFYWAEKDVKRK